MNSPREYPPYRTALVTGAARGMGRAIALALADEGLRVVLLDREGQELADLTAEINARYQGAAEGHMLDLRDSVALNSVVEGREIDVLVNNAGILPALGPAQEADPNEIDAQIDINLRVPLHLTRLVLPGMTQRRLGHVFFLGSIAGTYPYAHTAVYSATKGGIHAYVRSLRFDLVGTSVRATVMAPGRVETRIYDGIFGGPEGAQRALYTDVESIQPQDMARLLVSALRMPRHIDVSFMEIMPTDQAVGGTTTLRPDGSEVPPAFQASGEEE